MATQTANGTGVNLEVEDAGVALIKILVVGDHPGQSVLLQSQGCDGGEQPAVACGEVHTGALWVKRRPHQRQFPTSMS